MFIAVSHHKADRVSEVSAYLYSGQAIVSEPVNTRFGSFVVVDTGTAETFRSEYLRDRIQSGMFGAVLFATREEADAYIGSWVSSDKD